MLREGVLGAMEIVIWCHSSDQEDVHLCDGTMRKCWTFLISFRHSNCGLVDLTLWTWICLFCQLLICSTERTQNADIVLCLFCEQDYVVTTRTLRVNTFLTIATMLHTQLDKSAAGYSFQIISAFVSMCGHSAGVTYISLVSV